MAEKKYDKLWKMAEKRVAARRAEKGKTGAPAKRVGKTFMDKMTKRTDFKKDGSKRVTSMEGADYYMSQKMKRMKKKDK
jgi:hypothetical protein